jgi:hypothetical protein
MIPVGVVYDTRQNNYLLSLEGSRQLSDSWHLKVEGRLFAGGTQISARNRVLILSGPEYKHAWLDREDYLQIEFRKYF